MRRTMHNSVLCAIFGTVIAVLGGVLMIAGYNMFNNFAARTKFYLTYGREDNSGMIIMIIGAVVIGIGVVLWGLSLYFRRMTRHRLSDITRQPDYENVDNVIEQMAGTKTIFDVFHSADKTQTFSFYRNKTCILKEGDQVYRGRMKALTWEAGHPTLWRVTLDIDGAEKVLEISKTEGNILVKSGDEKEIYYRN